MHSHRGHSQTARQDRPSGVPWAGRLAGVLATLGLLLGLLAPAAQAAHTYDTKARGTGAGNPQTLSYTCGSGATLLVLGIVTAGATARTGGAPTYNSVAMTQVDSTRVATETNVEMWYLANPPTGAAYNISVPNTGALTLYLIASSYKAASGYTSTLDVSNGNSATGTGSTNPSVAVTTTVNGDAVVDILGDGYASIPTGHSNTLLYSTDDGSYSDNAQYALKATAGSITLSWTVAQDDWAMVVGAFKEVPFAPVATAATNVLATSFSANWNTVAGATGYRLDVATDSGFTAFVTGYNNLDVGNVLTYSVSSNISANTTYYYRVRAYNANGTSGNSNTISLTSVCAAPVATAATSVLATSFSANWNTVAGATGYRLDVATDSGFTSFVTGYNNLDVGNVLTYSVSSNISANTTYYYRVRAYNANGTSGNSNTISLTTASYNFQYRRAITIADSMTPASCGSNLSSFPILVSISSDGNLKTVANGGHVQKTDGSDIIFRATDSAICTDTGNPAPCTLDHEIETYDGGAGTLVAWVRIPTLAYNANSTIYMYYGNSGIDSSTANPTGVWDNNFIGVWHLKEKPSDTAPQFKDSTSLHNDGTQQNMVDTDQQQGKVDGSIHFNGTNAYIPTNVGASVKGLTQFTISTWVNADTAGNDIYEECLHTGTNTRVKFLITGNKLTLQGRALDAGGIVNWAQAASTASTGTWYYAAGVFNSDAGVHHLMVNGVDTQTTLATSGMANTDPQNPPAIGSRTIGGEYWKGYIDEFRISNTARSVCWLGTEYNSMATPASVGAEEASPPTVVDLLSFKATGDDGNVLVSWTTAQEISNVGFHVYRSESVGGPYTRITDNLIPGLTFSVRGRDYGYVDRNVTSGRLYYYKLEDIDFDGTRTMHGPVCVDWDGDGIPDDWEQRYGLNPAVDDSGLDPDGDGLTNLQEYYSGTDPLRADSDGDGVIDSQENGGSVSQGLMRGVEVIASDSAGMTLELRTENFESVVLDEGGVSYQRLRVPEYVHGYTDTVGKPELPVKGILIDLPSGKGGTLSIESVESKELSDYWIYPVPEKVVGGEGELATVSEVFTIDDAAYRVNSFYPDVVARAGETYDYREQKKLQVFFNPFSFNPVTRELVQYTRIRVRVAYVALAEEQPVVRSGVPLTSAPSGLARAVAWAPSVPASAYKMLVSEEGIYRVTSDWLTSQGVSVSDWSQVRVYNLGQEIPVYQGADNIEFYGTPPGEDYSKYTRYNVYWLTTSGGSGVALRMGLIDGTPGTAAVSSTHEFTVHDERDESYIMDAPGEDSLDRWCFSNFVLGEAFPAADGGGLPQDFTVTLPGVTGNGSLRLNMLGYYDTAHEVEVSVNGAVVGTYTWDGLTFLEAAADGVTFSSGDNTVTLKCKSGTDPMDPDVIVVDWIELSYPRDYVATNNLLKFSHDAGYGYQITGFTDDDVEAFDITSATDVKRVVHLVSAGDRVDMEPQGTTGTRTYMALSSSAVKEPVGLTQDRASSLSSASNGADYILITHRDLGWDVNGDPYPWLSSLTSLRQAQGLRVKVVDVEDIYDEFSYGIASPQGIKDFLSYAYSNWVQPKPQYVLIVGDATNDPKNNENLDESGYRYVPSYLTFTEHLGETVTDDWYARVSGSDAIPDLYIGRLPAATVGQAAAMVGKIIAYENSANSKTWEKNVLLVSDNQVDDYEAIFEQTNDDAAAYIPAGMNAPFKEYLGNYSSAAQLTGVIENRINNDGTLVANYAGHGSVQIWAEEHIFDTGDVGDLSNADRLPFIVSMTCLNGYFAYPEADAFPSLAEALLRPGDRGAVAVFASTGMTEPEGQRVLDDALFEAIFKRDLRRLGPAISYAKQELMANGVEYEEVSETFLLFGDPATVLKVPLPTAPVNPTGQVGGGSVTMSWGASTDANGGAVAGYNVYRSTSPNGPYTKLNSSLMANTQYMDSSAQSGTYYYVIKSVDRDGDESPGTLEMSVTIGARSVGGDGGSGGGGGGGCFISTIAN